MARRTYIKIDANTAEETETTPEVVTTRKLDRDEIGTKIWHLQDDMATLQRETDSTLGEKQLEIDRLNAILDTLK